jgi:hypothetical protein
MVTVRDGSLEWVASIDTTPLKKQVSEITSDLNSVAKKANSATGEFAAGAAANVNKLAQSVETLRAKILAREDFIIKETDLSRIAQYNKEIEILKSEITRLMSAGRTGFDDQGNAIQKQLGLLQRLQRQAELYKNGIRTATLPENIAKYNQKLEATNVQIAKLSNAGKKGFDELGNATKKVTGLAGGLQKGFSFFRQAAFLIPGLGIAGIFNLIGEGVAALVTSLFKSNDALSTFKQNYKNLNEVVAQANKEAGKQITDLKLLYAAATNVNLSLKERHAAVVALQKEFPDFFGNIKEETILNGGAKKSYDDLTASIIASSRARAAKDKLDAINAKKLDIEFERLNINTDAALKKLRIKQTVTDIRDKSGKIVGSVGGGVSSEEQIANQEAKRKRDVLEKDKQLTELNQQEKFLITKVGEKAITKVVTDEQKKRHPDKSSESSLNALLEKRKSIIQGIADIERDAVQSGLTKEATEIDKINERREKELGLIKDLNTIIDTYNAKHKTKVEKIGQAEIDSINASFDTLIKNLIAKKEAEIYIQSIKDKQKAFDDFQKAQETGNDKIIEQAREANKEQLGGFTSFVDLLRAEWRKLFDTLNFDEFDDIGQVTRFDAVAKLLEQSIKDADEKEKKALQDKFDALLKATETFNQQRADINRKYNDQEATLEKTKGRFSPEEFILRKKAIDDARAEELKALENNLARQSDLYKLLNEDIIRFTKKQIEERIKLLEKILKTDTTLTPEMKKAIQSAIDQYKELLKQTNTTAQEFAKLAGELSSIGGSFGKLASSITPLNKGLGETLQLMSDTLSAASDLASAISSFESGDIIEGVSSLVSALTEVFKRIGEASESKKSAKQKIIDFNTQIITGELEYDEILRQRARDAVKTDKLKLEGLRDYNKLLKEQQSINKKIFDDTLKKLQQESFISKEFSGNKNRGIFSGVIDFIFPKKEVKQQLESLSGKTFDEIEKLFNSGQLTDKAKALFEQLQKLKQEGLDIDALLVQNAEDFRAAITGTTADNLADSIIQGFKEGKRAAGDFADTFQENMENAILQSLKSKALEGPLKEFFAKFAEDADSGGSLTSGEIDRLRTMYNNILNNAQTQFDQLQNIAGLNFASSTAGGGNTLTGAIRGITEQQAELLAGQFGGLRLSAIEQLKIATQGLNQLQKIENNTFQIHEVKAILRRLEINGIKVI